MALGKTLSSVALTQLDELPALRVRNAAAEALIVLRGAQVLEFVERGRQPLLWLSERAEFRRGQTIRGGIPVCWPWFGDLARNPDPVRQLAGEPAAAPAHGLVRAQDWLLHAIDERPDQTEITLRCPTLPAHWPHATELLLTIGVGRTLTLQLTTKNTGATPLALTQALHTYFAVSDIRAVTVPTLADKRYIDTLRNWSEQIQTGVENFSGETDRIYCDLPERLQLHDAQWRRAIHLRAAHSSSAVLWNPWIEKSKRLSQFADDAWQRMLCIETANVLEDAVTLAPGAAHTLEMETWTEV